MASAIEAICKFASLSAGLLSIVRWLAGRSWALEPNWSVPKKRTTREGPDSHQNNNYFPDPFVGLHPQVLGLSVSPLFRPSAAGDLDMLTSLTLTGSS
ncbi:hypothetical protein F4814DRAFT_282275 [Daldinia grandis]|nr:hypothetical protein F4814DRAFT_282275 [Daldinia grandis]